MGELIAIRYRSLRAFLRGARNELAYRLGWQRAAPLLSLNLELTNHCNLHCCFCPTGNGLLGRARGFMAPEIFRRALDGAGPLEFALLFQWGESLLHPRFFELAAEARQRGIRTLLTTNGTLLDDRRVAALLAAGLDRVTVSVDGDEQTHEAVRQIPYSLSVDGLERLLAARDREDAPLALDVSMVVAPETEAACAAFSARFKGRVDRVQQIPLLTDGRRRTRCREPWRGGLVVLQDGTVTVCCVDHDGELALGHVEQDRLADLWNGEAIRSLRRQHVAEELPSRCARCSEYPSDVAAPRFSKREESSRRAPHRALDAGRRAGRPSSGAPLP